jgi:hypothetical protein
MEPSPAQAFRKAAEKTIELPSGLCVTIRKLGMDELLDVPEAWPIFGVFLDKITGDDEEQAAERREIVDAAFRKAEVQVALIRVGVTSPRVLRADEEDDEDAVAVNVFDTMDRNALSSAIALLATGFGTLAEVEDAADKAAGFSETPDAENGGEGG